MLKSGTRQELLSLLLFNVELKIADFTVRNKNATQDIEIEKEKFLKYLIESDIILRLKSPGGLMLKLIQVIRKFSHVEGYKINTQKSIVFVVQTLAVKKYNERDDIFIYNNKKKVKYLEVKEMSNAQNLHVKDFKKLLKVTQVVLSK